MDNIQFNGHQEKQMRKWLVSCVSNGNLSNQFLSFWSRSRSTKANTLLNSMICIWIELGEWDLYYTQNNFMIISILTCIEHTKIGLVLTKFLFIWQPHIVSRLLALSFLLSLSFSSMNIVQLGISHAYQSFHAICSVQLTHYKASPKNRRSKY